MLDCERILKPYRSFDVNHPSRYAAAVRDISLLLCGDGLWHAWTDVVSSISTEHGLKPATVSNILHMLVKEGEVERQGVHTSKVKNRQIRVVRKYVC